MTKELTVSGTSKEPPEINSFRRAANSGTDYALIALLLVPSGIRANSIRKFGQKEELKDLLVLRAPLTSLIGAIAV
jgi:hypothetical protein